MPTLPEPKNLFADSSGPKLPETKSLFGGEEEKGDEDWDGRPAEETSKEELTELQKGFKDRAKKEDERFVEATDSEYWIAVCFQTRDMKEEFLTKTGLLDYGDKYLDGMQVAAKLGVTLESPVPPVRNHVRRSQVDRLAQ